MNFLTRFGHFWYDFIVGDDWTIAGAVVVALLVTSALVRVQIAAWWLLPLVVLGFLGLSVFRVARNQR